MSRSVAKCLLSVRIAGVSNLSSTRNQAAFHGPTLCRECHRLKEMLKHPVLKERVNLDPAVELDEGCPGITKLLLVFPVIVQHMPANGMDHDYDEIM